MRRRPAAALAVVLLAGIGFLGLHHRADVDPAPTGPTASDALPLAPATLAPRGAHAATPGGAQDGGPARAPDAGSRGDPSPEAPAAPAAAGPPGTSSLYGTVRRGADPVSATIEVRHVAIFGGAEARVADALYAASLFVPEPTTPVIAEVKTGPDGRFELNGLAPAIYDLALRVDGVRYLVRAKLLTSGSRSPHDVELPPAGLSLTGRVVHADGRPWRGWVDARNEDAGATEPAVAFVDTDADGRFVVSGLRAGSVSLRVGGEGCYTVTRDGFAVLPHPSEVVFVADERVEVVEGLVVAAPDRQPIPGAAWTTWTHDGADHCAATGRTDAQGRFRMPTLTARGTAPPFDFLRVAAPGYEPVSGRIPARRDPITLQLHPAGRVEGLVREAASGRPVVGARVIVAGAGGIDEVTSDAAGRYAVVDALEGPGVVAVVGDHWVSVLPPSPLAGTVPPMTLISGGEIVSLDLGVERASVVEGRTVDDAGQPVPGRVTATLSETRLPERLQRWIDEGATGDRGTSWTLGEKGVMTLLQQLVAACTREVSVGEDGRYRLDGLLPNLSYRLTAEATSRGRRAEVDVTLKSGETRALELRLSTTAGD